MSLQHIQGNIEALGSRVHQLENFSHQLQSASDALKSAKDAGQALRDAGFPDEFDGTLDKHITQLALSSQNALKAAQVLIHLINQLEAADQQAASPESNAPTIHPGLTLVTVSHPAQDNAENARQTAADQLMQLLPGEIYQRYKNVNTWGSASVGDYLFDLWNEGVVGTVTGLISLIGMIGGAVIGDENARQSVGYLVNGILTGKNPDGSDGFDQSFLGGILGADLAKRDPAAWQTLAVLSIFPLGALSKVSKLRAAFKSGAIGLRTSKEFDAFLEEMSSLDREALKKRLGEVTEVGKLPGSSSIQRTMKDRGLERNYLRMDGTEIVWSLDPKGVYGRGGTMQRLLTVLLAQKRDGLLELPWPHRTIDLIENVDTGAYIGRDADHIISIKSIDTDAPSYQSLSTLSGVIEENARVLSKFEGVVSPLNHDPIRLGTGVTRELALVVPSSISSAQLDLITKLINNYKSYGIDITLVEAAK